MSIFLIFTRIFFRIGLYKLLDYQFSLCEIMSKTSLGTYFYILFLNSALRLKNVMGKIINVINENVNVNQRKQPLVVALVG